MTDHLEAGIVTADAGALAQFYVGGLGFVVESVRDFPQGEVHRLVRGEARLKLYQPAGGAVPGVVADPWHRHVGFAYAALHVDDAGAEVVRVVDHGGTVEVEVTQHRPGARFALVRDPEGNVWEVLEEHDDTKR